MMDKFANNKSKVILVTGGNRGIGLEICKQLAELDHTVVMGTRDIDKGKAVAGKTSSKIDVQQLDVTNKVHIQNLTKYINKQYGMLNVLINNSGIISNEDGIIDADLDEVKLVLETNFFGSWYLSQILLPILTTSGSGRIINMSSGMGELASVNSNYIGYRLSKTLLNRLTLLMAEELKSKDVKVNAMCPGWVRTEMGGKSATRSVSQGADTAVWLSTTYRIPSGKFFRDRKVIDW